MINFSIDIKNIFFRIDTKIKIHHSSFCFKFLVVKLVKQDQVLTRNVGKCWKICNTWRRSLMWPWSVRIMRGSEHTRWFWRLWVPLQGLFFRMMTRIHTMKLFISKDFFLSQNSWYLVYNAESRVNKRDHKEFLKI